MIDPRNLCNSGMARPGGFNLTGRALEYCEFNPGARILDIGCGLGATVRYLRKKRGLEAEGIDIATDAPNCRSGDARSLPFEAESLDGTMFECSLVKMKNPEKALTEANRVLKPDGKLVVSGLYVLGDSVPPPSPDFLLTRKGFEQTLKNTGFSILLFEDHTPLMKELWGQMVLTYGQEEVYRALGSWVEAARHAKLGYCLVIGKKEGITS